MGPALTASVELVDLAGWQRFDQTWTRGPEPRMVVVRV